MLTRRASDPAESGLSSGRVQDARSAFHGWSLAANPWGKAAQVF